MYSPAVARQVRARGHDAVSVHDADYRRLEGAPDEEIFAAAVPEQRALVDEWTELTGSIFLARPENARPKLAAMIRRGDAIDVPFLRDMLHHAYYWRENDPLAADPVARYVVNFGRRGDAAVIAIEEHRRVGAAWYRLFSSEEPGFAFVDEQTPEAAIRLRFGRRSSAPGSSASTRSPSSAALASGSGASRRRPGCRPPTCSRRHRRASGSSASVPGSPASTSPRRTCGRPASSSS